jgi:hypothetical protein
MFAANPENRRHYARAGSGFAVPLTAIHNSDAVQIVASIACAPLVSAKDETMKISKPAPAAISLNHIAIPPLLMGMFYYCSYSLDKNKK